jgi:class 3 adenylate cyclase
MHQLPSGTVTLLFSDIEESTRLLQQLGTQYSELLTTCRHLQRTAFQQHQGYEVDTQGDSIFVAFARAVMLLPQQWQLNAPLPTIPGPMG